MGTFLGHVLPGSFIVALALWWTINIFKHFFASKRKSGIPFRSQPWYPGPFSTKFPIMSAFKMALPVIGTIMELASMNSDPFHYVNKNAVHITIYFCYSLNGTMDLLKYKGFPLPNGIEAASGLLAIGVEGFLITSHVHDGRPMLDVKVHYLLNYVIVGTVLSIFLEMSYPEHVIPSLARAYFTLLHGTWLFQIAFIIYTPFPGMREGDMMDHEQGMLASLIFAWHLVAVFVFVLLIGAGVWRWVKHDRLSYEVGYHLLHSPEITPPKMDSENGHFKDSCD